MIRFQKRVKDGEFENIKKNKNKIDLEKIDVYAN